MSFRVLGPLGPFQRQASPRCAPGSRTELKAQDFDLRGPECPEGPSESDLKDVQRL